MTMMTMHMHHSIAIMHDDICFIITFNDIFMIAIAPYWVPNGILAHALGLLRMLTQARRSLQVMIQCFPRWSSEIHQRNRRSRSHYL